MLLDYSHLSAGTRTLPCDGYAIDAAADHQQIKTLAGKAESLWALHLHAGLDANRSSCLL